MIEQATTNDLRMLLPLFHEFHATSKFLKGVPDAFMESWNQILRLGLGVVFVQREGSEIVGTLGGLATRDINSGHLVASEGFWFVRQTNRGSGLKLYKAFEKWARDRGCVQIQMVHLLDVNPESMAQLYGRMGYTAVETRYVMELQ
jgi:GNAT superfamily N-acetyltransferase